MNAIKNYLDNMFRNLPNTEEVRRAKAELLEMMEDKYEELIKEGKTENEAVGIVISEFGNLDELAETLGITEAVKENPDEDKPMLSMDRVKDYLTMNNQRSILAPLGILFNKCLDNSGTMEVSVDKVITATKVRNIVSEFRLKKLI